MVLIREHYEKAIRLYDKYPFLQSPAKLGASELEGLWANPKHLRVLNKELMGVFAGRTERLGAHMPPQHGKTWLASWMFPAWCLLNDPDLRIILGMHTDTYAATYGRRVRNTVERFGKPLGIRVSSQSSAANEWEIEGRIGRMVAKGVNSSPVGRPADLLIIDDPYENIASASSPKIRDRVWDWYFNDIYSRLGPKTRVVIVHTRFFTDDLAGRVYKKGLAEGKPWRVINFPAIAEENDILGRKKGDPLWQERVPLERLLEYRGTPFFDAIQQQHPVDAEGLYFQPRSWPTYFDIGDAWRVGRDILHHNGVTIAVTVDWATSEKETSDYTAIGVFGLTRDGRVLVLEVVNDRYRLEDCVPRGLAPVCRRWHPHVVSAEADVFQEAMVIQCRMFREIPPVRKRKVKNKTKLQRALPAIVMGGEGRIYRPMGPNGEVPPWWDKYASQLASFTGLGDEFDDMVDVTSEGCNLAQEFRGLGSGGGPVVLVPGKSVF